ncbi:hypothetical protein RHS04_07325 [Rhizoctonia solani]|uniref:Uncharacterized protein n=1 Tax=Rhizoctonia solani TaxID=456999 RepID=A0A8H7LHK2_9AGAM|nr:hypothetical protein RHS04_07325 [Rhizoctonia solani]
MADVNKPRGRGRPRGRGGNAASRVQAPREAQNIAAAPVAPELIARRNKRRVEELERSNYTDVRNTDLGTGLAGNRSRTTLADDCNKGRKKSTTHVRSILLYRKNLNAIIEQEHLRARQKPENCVLYVGIGDTIDAPDAPSLTVIWGAKPRIRIHVVNGELLDVAAITRNDGFDSVGENSLSLGLETRDRNQDWVLDLHIRNWAYPNCGLALVGGGSVEAATYWNDIWSLQREDEPTGTALSIVSNDHLLLEELSVNMGGDHMCPVCSATFTRPQHVARHMRSHTGDRPYACQTCGDRFARSDLLSRHVNKCHTPGGLANTTSRKQGARNQSAASDDKKRRPCEECTQSNTKCDFGRPSCNNCSSRGSKCNYPKTKRPRRNTNPSPNNVPGTLPEHAISLPQEPMINSFGHYQEDMPPFNFHYPPPDNPIAMPPIFDNTVPMPNPASNTFMGSPEAPSLSFSAATSESADSSPWNGMDLMGLNNVPSNFDGGVFHDPNAPSYTSSHKFQTSMGSPFSYNIDSQHEPSQIPLTTLHQRPASASYQRHPIQHHQRHRSSPSLDGSHQLLNQALLRAQGQQYPAITPTRLYMHRGSVSASDSGTDYESSGRPGTASEYTDFPSPMSLVGSESGSTTSIGRAIDDIALHDPGASSLLSMGPMMVPGIGMGTGLTPQVESPSRPSMTQRQSTFGDLKAFWNECMDGQNQPNGEGRGHSLAKMTSMPCLKTPRGDATPRAAAVDPLTRIGQQRPQSGAGQTPRVGGPETKGLEQYRSALNALPAPSLQMAPKMKAAAAKQEESDSKTNIKNDPTFPPPFAPGTLQGDAWRSLMTNTGSYVVEPSNNRPNYKRLPSQTLGPENSKRAKDGDDNAVLTDDDDDDATETDYKQSQQEWHRRMSLPALGRSGVGAARLRQPQPVPASGRQGGVLN